MGELALSIEQEGRDWRVRADGELDVATAPRMSARLDEVVGAGQGDVTIDLRGLRFVDSHGLHALLNTQRRLIRQERRLEVVCAPGEVHRVFELTRLTETLGVRVRSTRPVRSSPG